MKSYMIWAAAALLYATFFFWYTSLAGPMSNDEVEARLQTLRAQGAPEDQLAAIEQFMRSDTGNDFIMINLLDANEAPPNLPATGPNATPDDLMDHYMEYLYGAQLVRASHPVFFGVAVADAMDVSGIEGAEHWERGALVRYRSRRDLMDIVMNPRFSERHDYKMGALTKTIAYPVEPVLHPGDLRFLLAILLVAITAVIHLIMFRRPG